MLTIWTDKISHSTVGSSFRVTFVVTPNELEYLNKLYDYFNSMNMTSFYIAADRKDEPQTDYGDYERAVEQMQHDMRYEPTYNAEDGSM